ncbi:MAG: glycosyltransferase family 2 protein [Planctomycetota bacterium]
MFETSELFTQFKVKDDMAESTLDIVIPLYNEFEIVEQLHDRVTQACRKIEVLTRIIYVDDGSTDGTVPWLMDHALSSSNPNCCGDSGNTTNQSYSPSVTLVQLSRNFGQPPAILAGLNHSDADCVVLMDGDLQDPPEIIPELFAEFQAGNDVVIAKRKSRQESFVRGLLFRSFHQLFQYLSDSPIEPNTGTFCLMSRRACEAVRNLPETHRFFPGLRTWVGFQTANVLYDRQQRAGGSPKQTFVRLVRYAFDAIFGFSLKPLRLLTGVGAIVCIISMLLASWFIFKRAVGWETASIGFTTLTCGVFCLGGFQLVGMGVLGEYLGRIYNEVKARPHYLVAKLHESESADQRELLPFEPTQSNHQPILRSNVAQQKKVI